MAGDSPIILEPRFGAPVPTGNIPDGEQVGGWREKEQG